MRGAFAVTLASAGAESARLRFRWTDATRNVGGFVASLLVHRRAASDAEPGLARIEERLAEIERLIRKDAA